MDNMLLKNLNIPGVELKERDNHKLERETIEMLVERQFEKLCRKQQATRNTGAASIDDGDSIDKFYSRGNKVD